MTDHKLADRLTQRVPLLSVIIVSYNAVSTVRSAIESVLGQKDTELIVIDGASTDGTAEVINEYVRDIACYISEPDSGIYEAMNKGVLYAMGKWVYFLGSDDRMVPDIVSIIEPTLELNEFDLIYGAIQYTSGKYFKSNFSIKTILHNTIHHQSAFYKRSILIRHKFDVTFRIIADYEINLIIYLTDRSVKNIPQVIAVCLDGGSSHNFSLSLSETNQVRGKHVSPFVNHCLSFILKTKYFLQYVLLRKI